MQAALNQSTGALAFYISGVMTFSTGIFLTAVRFVEPLFRYLLLSIIYQYYGLEVETEGETE